MARRKHSSPRDTELGMSCGKPLSKPKMHTQVMTNNVNKTISIGLEQEQFLQENSELNLSKLARDALSKEMKNSEG
jgi:hypothetical protein